MKKKFRGPPYLPKKADFGRLKAKMAGKWGNLVKSTLQTRMPENFR